MLLENDSKNVKTIMFSELPKTEKSKFFNILLENEINFTRDEKGYYVALVKVLNPAFHGEVNQKPLAVKKQGIKNEANQSYQSTPQKRESIDNKKHRSSSQSGINLTQTKGEYYNTTKAQVKNQTISSPAFEKNQTKLSTKSKLQIEKSKDNFKKPTQSIHEAFSGSYRQFLQALNPLIGVRGKKMNLYQLKYYIEEIYSIRFIKDTSTLRNQLMKNSKNNSDLDMKDPFPSFVVEFLANKYIKKPMIDQHALDLLLSSDYFKASSKEIKIFSKFLNEEYDTDDLIFFLFVRSCVEKEMKIMFIEKAKEEIKLQHYEDKEKIDTELYLNIKTCFRIANTIFGNEEELLLNSFMEKIEQYLISSQKFGKNMIAASTILEITLEDYHQSRQMYSYEKSNLNSQKLIKKESNCNINENMFDEFEVETNDFKENPRKNSLSNVQNKEGKIQGLQSNNLSGHNNMSISPNKESSEKINNIKAILSAYIKEKELDIFFEKLMASYSLNERDYANLELIMTTIKELVTKKLGLLINIVFSQDQKNWFSSLKIKEEDQQSMKHFQLLTQNVNQLISFYDIEDIPLETVDSFCQTLLSTPELNNQIHKLILKHFS